MSRIERGSHSLNLFDVICKLSLDCPYNDQEVEPGSRGHVCKHAAACPGARGRSCRAGSCTWILFRG